MKKIFIYFFAIYFLSACAQETAEQQGYLISIEINAANEIKVAGETVSAEELQDVLTQQIAAMVDNGIQRDSIITNLRIDRQAQMGTVTDLVKTMQALGLSRIDYEGMNPEVRDNL